MTPSVQARAGRVSPADSAADIHDSGAALDVVQPQLRQAGAQRPTIPLAAGAGSSPAQQPPPTPPSPPPEKTLTNETDVGDADAEQQGISPAQGADFTQVTPRAARPAHRQPLVESMTSRTHARPACWHEPSARWLSR